MAELQLRLAIAMLVMAFEFQPVGEERSGVDAEARLLRHPKHCFVRLRKSQ